jgi:hypothetical protein
VRVCSSRWAPRRVHCICWRLAKRLLTTALTVLSAMADEMRSPKQPPDGLPRPFRDGFVRLHERHQLFQLVGAQGNREAELSRQAPHGVGQHRLLLDQQRTSGMQGQDALLLQALGWYERHVWPGRGLADCGDVGGVVLLALLDERPDRLGRDQLHGMSKAGQHARPVMSGAARLHHDRASCLIFKEGDQLAPTQLALDLCLAGFVHGVDLKHGLGGIQADHGYAHRGRLLVCRHLAARNLAHRCRWGRPPHLIPQAAATYTVRGFAAASGGSSTYESAQTTVSASPGALPATQAQAADTNRTSSSVTMNWSATAASYRVLARNGVGTAYGSLADATVTTNSYTFTGLAASSSPRAVVIPQNANGYGPPSGQFLSSTTA